MPASSLSRLHIVSRMAAGILGSYVFAWGLIALVVGLLFAAGMPFHDAEALSYMLAFMVFLVTFCWAFASASIRRVWLVLAGGGGLMTGVAWAVQRALL